MFTKPRHTRVGYYHTTASYWATGALQSLSGIPGVPTINYGANGPGSTAKGATRRSRPPPGRIRSRTSPTPPAAQPIRWGALTGVTFGLGGQRQLHLRSQYRAHGTYTFSVNGQTDTGRSTWNYWNPNGTLAKPGDCR